MKLLIVFTSECRYFVQLIQIRLRGFRRIQKMQQARWIKSLVFNFSFLDLVHPSNFDQFVLYVLWN